MPRYTFVCGCGHTDENVVVPMEARDHPVACTRCNGFMQREFPYQAARGYMPFESYYDEALDLDIHGRRQKQHELKARGLVEAGDRVRGARNFDKHAPHHVKPLPPKGVTYDVYDKRRRLADKAEGDFKIAVGQPNKKPDFVKISELPKAKK